MMLKHFVDVVLICAGIAVVMVTSLFIVSMIRNFIKNWRDQ